MQVGYILPLCDIRSLKVFSDCPAELGCSVVLKGRSMRELRAAKRILRHMVLALYSSRLELELLSMFGASVAQRSPDCLVCSLNADETDSDPVLFFIHRLILEKGKKMRRGFPKARWRYSVMCSGRFQLPSKLRLRNQLFFVSSY